MKQVIFSILSFSLVMFTACQKDDVKPTTSQKLQGKWRLDKSIDELYKPSTVLLETETQVGNAGDSIVIKANTIVSYSDTQGSDETNYVLLNDTTIKIEDEIYKIRTLNNQQLYLHFDETDAALNERYVQRLYFKK